MESRLQAWKKYGERVCDCLKANSSSWIKPTTIEEYVAFLRLVVIIVIIITRKPSSLGNRIGSWSYINNSSNDCQDTHNDCECFPNVQSHWQLFKGCSERVKKTWKGFFSSVFVWIKMSGDKKREKRIGVCENRLHLNADSSIHLRVAHHSPRILTFQVVTVLQTNNSR